MIQWQSTEILSVLTIIFPVVHKIINGFYHFALCWNYMMSQSSRLRRDEGHGGAERGTWAEELSSPAIRQRMETIQKQKFWRFRYEKG